MDCSSPIVGGCTGRAVLIPADSARAVLSVIGNNAAIVGIPEELYAIDNSMLTTPFDGSNTTGSNEAGRAQFVKTFSGRILTRGADVSAKIVEAISYHGNGYVAVLEKRDKTFTPNKEGKYELVGANKELRCVDPSTVVRNENENGGSVSFSLQTTEGLFEIDHVAGVSFNGLWNAAINR